MSWLLSHYAVADWSWEIRFFILFLVIHLAARRLNMRLMRIAAAFAALEQVLCEPCVSSERLFLLVAVSTWWPLNMFF